MSKLHYSYLYGDSYFYSKDLMEIIDNLQVERNELRRKNKIITSFAYDLKQILLGEERSIHEDKPKDKEYKIDGTVYKNGKVVPSFE